MMSRRMETTARIGLLLILVSLLMVQSSESRYPARQHPPPASDHPCAESGTSDGPGRGPYPFHGFVTLGAIRTYQLLISPSKGTSCPMHPHCSLYGLQVFQRYNPVQAFLMTADRLHRCGHDLHNYEAVVVDGFVRWSDPADPSSIEDQLSPHAYTGSASGTTAPPGRFPDSGTSPQTFLDDTGGEETRLLHFAKQLQSEGSYDLAITEYRRFLTYYPDSRDRDDAVRSILFCHYQAGQYLAAIHWGQNILEYAPRTDDTDDIRFLIGASYFRVGNYPRARDYLDGLTVSSRRELREKSLLLTGLSHAQEANWEDAEHSFARVPIDSEFSSSARQCERLCREGINISPKSPFIAGVLAIVPGLGYLYDGYGQTALSSFIVNGLFMWGTYEAFHKDHQGLGTILGVLSFGWYAGNIYGSVVSAERRNMRVVDELLLQFDVGFQF